MYQMNEYEVFKVQVRGEERCISEEPPHLVGIEKGQNIKLSGKFFQFVKYAKNERRKLYSIRAI